MAGDERQTWWLSFCDGDRPTGEQLLGVVVVDVTVEDVRAGAVMSANIRLFHACHRSKTPKTAGWRARFTNPMR